MEVKSKVKLLYSMILSLKTDSDMNMYIKRKTSLN